MSGVTAPKYEGDCACGLVKGRDTGVFFSVSLGQLHKVPACSPPNHSIYPWNSCPTLRSPSLPPSLSVPLSVRLSLSPLSLNMLQGGWRQIWLYNYTCVISSRLSLVTDQIELVMLVRGAFAGTVRKGIQLKFTSGWLTLAQWGRMYT